MPKSIRVKLSPTPAPRTIAGADDRENKVTGLEVALETRGKSTTLATLARQPAKLVFHLATFRRIRTPDGRRPSRKEARKIAHGARALADLDAWMHACGIVAAPVEQAALATDAARE